ncbi:MAG: hypothetical protein QOI74_3061 [Micromonosporaceae bacterium]|nr:hypothetical protein [Micromonosporaceae bacterium]
MDELSVSRSRPQPPEVRFVPDRRYTALAAGGALGALIAVLLTDDAGGRLLFGLAAVILLVYVVSDLVFSPRLAASAAGVVINSPMTRARLSWDDVQEVRADTRIRHGLRSTTLEIDAGPVLAVLSRRALGAEPVDVAALVEAFRPQTPR